MNADTEMAAVMEIVQETDGNPERREQRLKELYASANPPICPGVACKCDPGVKFCPRHGRQ